MKYVYSVKVDKGCYEDAVQWTDSIWSDILDAENRKQELITTYRSMVEKYKDRDFSDDDEYDTSTEEGRNTYWKEWEEYSESCDINFIIVERVKINTIIEEREIMSMTSIRE